MADAAIEVVVRRRVRKFASAARFSRATFSQS
jgi:hypothetical protein